ncbi:MAG TPA: phenylalanine--tRNA ligase subunit beta, partial [Candidatus Kapabacteria bacterium]|nr:phenylalanine--tRNA ligase subunit beta [Candidatus Kapabacteria bacterium]
MQISYNWLKELLNFNLTASEVIDLIQSYGIEVEHIIDFKEKYRNFYIGRILERELLPKSDHLSVLKVEVANDVYTIICGAPNCDANQNVVVALPGAVIPSNDLVIERRKIRGVESNGMVCSKQELGISDDHSGIWILGDDAPLGATFAEYFNSNDIILEIGITPNRADWLSHFGVAREIAAVKGLKRITPEIDLKEEGNDIQKNCKVIIESPDKCMQYVARIVRNVKVQESPQWLK